MVGTRVGTAVGCTVGVVVGIAVGCVVVPTVGTEVESPLTIGESDFHAIKRPTC